MRLPGERKSARVRPLVRGSFEIELANKNPGARFAGCRDSCLRQKLTARRGGAAQGLGVDASASRGQLDDGWMGVGKPTPIASRVAVLRSTGCHYQVDTEMRIALVFWLGWT